MGRPLSFGVALLGRDTRFGKRAALPGREFSRSYPRVRS
jgi:hypothetical protein